ncbi:stage III sporulation protein AF [Syntrophomonas zehnderi]|nr:stage III sporulation protein AF [Syntrophomonas zehnderi]
MVRNLLVIIIISSFLELLVPEGRIKPFVRLAVGLFILIAILSPTLNLLSKNQDLKVNLWDYQMEEGIKQEVQEKGKNLNQQMMDTGENIIKDKIQGQISAVSNLVPGVHDVETQVQMEPSGDLKKVKITVRTTQPDRVNTVQGINVFSSTEEPIIEVDQKQIKNKITQVINNLYGLPSNDVEIEFEGG